MATLSLRLDRVKGVANVVSQDRIYIRDEAVAVTIEGFANGEESLAPCLQVMHGRFAVAEAMINVTPSNDGATATATLNTNTRQLVDAFCGCSGATMHQFQFRIFSTTSQKPIAIGVCSIWNFTAGEGEPSNLPSASEVLSELENTVNGHIADKANPHEVTKGQLGLGNVDNTADADKPISTAERTALESLQSAFVNALATETNQRTQADASLQSQISAHSTAIENNRAAATAAINAEGRVRASADSSLAGGIIDAMSAIDAERIRAIGAESSKADLEDGKVPSSQLPSYVDDVLEFATLDAFPSVGERGKIYIALDTNRQYRWSGTQYIEIGGGGAGEDANAVHYYAETKTAAEKTQARENIGAMAADAPIPSVSGKLPMKPLPKYLHYLEFDDTYLADARAWYATHANDSLGGCSAVRKDGLLGRNYDWNYDEMAEFVVSVSAANGRHASVGVANVRTELTEEIVCSGVHSPLYRVLPGRTVDGINDAGVVAEVNVIPRDETKDPVQSETRNLHAFEVVRHVLDNYASAEEAAEYVAAHYYIPDGDYSYHWMIADANGTYIVEDGRVVLLSLLDGLQAITNYRVGVADDPYGNGYARRTILGGSGTVAELLEAVKFTNAYASGWPWPDEFAAVGVGTHDQTDTLKAWAETYVAPLLDPTTRKPAARGNGCWQTVHSSIYDFAAKTMKVAVQEVDDWYVFAVGAVAGYEPPAGGIPKADLAQGVQESLDKAESSVQKDDSVPRPGNDPTIGEIAAAMSAVAGKFMND